MIYVVRYTSERGQFSVIVKADGSAAAIVEAGKSVPVPAWAQGGRVTVDNGDDVLALMRWEVSDARCDRGRVREASRDLHSVRGHPEHS